jgi:nucleotide-binding universal stress UspA family protein
VERLLIGSVSERVVHQVDRPVLVVRSARAL